MAEGRPYTINVVEAAPPKREAAWCPPPELGGCGGARWNEVGPHAPHRNKAGVLVDCRERPIPQGAL